MTKQEKRVIGVLRLLSILFASFPLRKFSNAVSISVPNVSRYDVLSKQNAHQYMYSLSNGERIISVLITHRLKKYAGVC